MKDTSWMSEANCRGISSPDIFHPEGNAREARLDAQAAISICRDCVVVFECEQWAKQFSRGVGVWAGTLRGASRPPGRPKRVDPWPITHGTVAGYQQHHKQNIPLCAECVEANKAYRRRLGETG